MYRNVTLHIALLASPAPPLPPRPTSERQGLFTWFASAISIFRVIHFKNTNVIHNFVTNSIHLGVLYAVKKENALCDDHFLPFVTQCQRSNRVSVFMKFGMEILYKTLLRASKFYLGGPKNLENMSKISIRLLRNVWISPQRFSRNLYFLNGTVYSFNTSNST